MLAITAPKTSPFQNLAKLLAMAIHDKYRVVRVVNHTANVTDGHVIIRRSVEVPDGAYNINSDGSLSPTRYKHGLEYPDIELLRPPLERLNPFCELPLDLMSAMIELCVAAHQLSGVLILNKEEIYLQQNQAMGLKYAFNIPQTLRITPKYLWIALVEMMQYPVVYLLKEINPHDKNGESTPLVIGHDWGSCALIMIEREAWTDTLE